MLFVIQETKDSFSLVHDDCTIDSSVVQSVVLELSKNFKTELTSYSAVQAADFVDCDKKVYWTINKTKEIEKSNLYEASYIIVKKPTKTITSIEEKNIVRGNGILYDFHDTDIIQIDGERYTIDKARSDIDYLVLKKPVSSDLRVYNPVVVVKEHILLQWQLKQEIFKKINSFGVCDDCNSDITDMMCDIFKLIRIQNAIECGDVETAKVIFNSLKSKYSNELC